VPDGTSSPNGFAADDGRRESWERDEWNYIGIAANTNVFVPIGGESFFCFVLTSPGCFGIESDSGQEYLDEVYEEEKANLLGILKTLNVEVLGA
jgi:hypothetical protein